MFITKVRPVVNHIKKVLIKLFIAFTYFNLIMLLLSLGIWQLTWFAISLQILTGVSIVIEETPPLPDDLGFTIPVLAFSALTFLNLVFVFVTESFHKTFQVECLQQDLELGRITQEEFNMKYRKLWLSYILFKG